MVRSKVFWLLLLSTSLLAGCSQATPEPTVDPAVLTVQAFDPDTALDQLPTFDVATLPTATLALPDPESLSTQELNDRLNPFGAEAVCELPCFLGLTPGISDIQDSFFFYRRLGIGSGDLVPGDVQGVADGEGSLAAALTKTTDIEQASALGLPPPNVEVFVEEEIVQYVYVAWRDYPDYLGYREFISQAGTPDRTQLAVNGETNAFLLQAAYDTGMFGYAVQGDLSDVEGGKQLCLDDQAVDVTYMGSFAPGVVPLEGLPNSQLLLPADETIGESFAEFVGSGEPCLTITNEQLLSWQQ